MTSLSNSRLQNCKERPNQSINNGDIVKKKTKRDMSEAVSLYYLFSYREAELLKIKTKCFVYLFINSKSKSH